MSAANLLLPVLRLLADGNRGRLAAGALLATATVLAGIALLGLSGWFITATALAGLVPATALMFDVFAPAAAIRLLALVRTAARYGERLVTHDATLGVLATLRVRLFRAFALPGAARGLLARPGRLLFRLTSDIDALESLYLRLGVPAVAAIGAALVAGAALSFIAWPMGLGLGLFLLVVGLGVPALAALAGRRAARRRALGLEALRARVIDLVDGQTDLLMAGRLTEQHEAAMIADAYLAAADDRLNRIETGAGFLLGAAGTFALVGVLLASAALVEAGAIGAPVAALALLIALAAMEPFAALRRGALEIGRSLLAIERLAPTMLTPPVPEAMPVPSNARLAVEIRGMTCRHEGAANAVLTALHLDIAVGERVALIGPSGAGKSSLMQVIAGELVQVSGHVATQPSALLTQRSELFRDTVAGNLRLAHPKAGDGELWAALEAAGLGADIRALPLGLASRLGDGGLGLSGGQARRLALTRLLLRPVPLWLLDEPTEALDGAVAADVLARLARAAEGRTLVIATHLRREAALADRLIAIGGGGMQREARKGQPGYDEMLAGLRAG